MAETSALKLLQACTTVLLLLSSSEAINRKIATVFWPNCNDFQNSCQIARSLGNNVVYTKASTTKHDNLYYVFSTIGIPTIVLARATGADSDLMFNWDKLMSNKLENSIYFKKAEGLKVDYIFAVAFTRLIEFNDIPDSASLNDKKLKPEDWVFRNFTDFFWDTLPLKSNENKFVFNTTSDFFLPEESNNGSLSFSFQVCGSGGRASELPALEKTANLTQLDFVLANYTPTFSKSRFALEAVLVSLSNNKKMAIDETQSIDDEYSPGVFRINNLLSNPSHQMTAGFLQWKPVSYLSNDRGRKSATKVKHYEIVDTRDRDLAMSQVQSSVVGALFGDIWNRTDVIIKSTNISFGLNGDGFYLKNNYTVWSSSVGYGQPPEDEISTTVIVIIAAGLGIPVILIIFGGIFTVVRRLRSRSGYQAISSDSLSRNNPQVN
ncbi:glycosylated lysosomal membrane protein [Elysia marginata]|uniref:Glycosylated lysosomal membrane protein n=1 Tax=Elysia marginata TaxID=1093978 RepID=A0AAV4F8S7_9GAST|nr:glycosylated lysosomal membrane protein [Elysia marginata]